MHKRSNLLDFLLSSLYEAQLVSNINMQSTMKQTLSIEAYQIYKSLSAMSEQQGTEQLKKQKGGAAGERAFGCPCGKTYLSYPALFTHVKQKHNGKPPGELIKPKTDKARGRPKIHVNIPEDDQTEAAFNLEEEIEQLLDGVSTVYEGKFVGAEGDHTCQNMATAFMSCLQHLNISQKNVVHCFLNELREFVEAEYGNTFWEKEKPSQIIDLVNKICHEHEEQKYPISDETLKGLIFILFRWMYKNKWTDHKLARAPPPKNQ